MPISPDLRQPLRPPGPPPRAAAVSQPLIEWELDTAVDARMAIEKSDAGLKSIADLTLRVTALETAVAELKSAKSQRNAIALALVGTMGSLVVGVVTWSLNFAAATKSEAVSRSKEAAQQTVVNAHESIESAYLRGVREGADAALEKQARELEDRGLVIAPRRDVKR